MKKFIKAVVVASVLVSASSAFATLSAGSTKPGSNGTGGVSCPHKINTGLFAATAVGQDAASSLSTGATQGGPAVR